MKNMITSSDEFDVSQVTYTAPKQLTNGGKTMYVNYKGAPLVFQTPMMKAPFGIRMWEGENATMPTKYTLSGSFEMLETRKPLAKFFESMQSLDERLITDAMENSMLWFKKKYPSVDVVKELYTPIVQFSKDKDTGEINTRYAPTMKLTLPRKDGVFDMGVFGPERDEISSETLSDMITSGRTKGANFQAIIQLTSIWMVGTKFGATWKIKQLRLNAAASMDKYAFEATEDEQEMAATYKPHLKTGDAAAGAGGAARGACPEDDEFVGGGGGGGGGGAKKSQSRTLLEESDDDEDIEA